MSGPQLFGTDGMRGTFGRPPLDEVTVRRLAVALALDLADRFEAPSVVLGGDTRDSTPLLCGWLAPELEARGVEVDFVGTLTTPGVTSTVLRRQASCGIAVSASHNPHPDNGIKLIDHRGFKWSPEAEAALESSLLELGPDDLELGRERQWLAETDDAAAEAYVQGLVGSIATPGRRPLEGCRIVLDAGNGAASPFARRLFEALGADPLVVNDQPNGVNINLDCGSTYPEKVARLVRDGGFPLGVAFDGDADRALLADDEGEVRDGDSILYLWACDLHSRGQLPGDAIVATSMSNLGLEVALQRRGISVVRCGVGDREVVTTMRERGLVLGGEQSGHIVNLALSTTGDGLLTAVAMADLIQRQGRPLSQLLADFEKFPQLLRNLRVNRKPPLDSLPSVGKASREVEGELGDQGRLVLRYSGTEPLVRIMIEGPAQNQIESLADRLEVVLAKELVG